MSEKYRAFSDPVHGFIKISKDNALEQLALSLIDTRVFQRLRHIKQLGVLSEVYPSANHTRFCHSLGAFFVAREMCEIVLKAGYGDEQQQEAVLIATLLHDIGHGPQSHIFEFISAKYFGISKTHESWGHEIITQCPEICNLLEDYRAGFSKEVGELLIGRNKSNKIYSSILSGSLDADRIDYLLRDRNSCGISGANLDKSRIFNSMTVAQNEEGENIIAIKFNALHAVEEFLKSRLDLYQHIYLHRREQAHLICMGNLFNELSNKPELLDDKYSPLEKMMKGDNSIQTYLQTTDADMSRLINRLSFSQDSTVAKLARQVRDRGAYSCVEFANYSTNTDMMANNLQEVQKILSKNKEAFLYDKTIKAYNPQKDAPIYIVNHRAGDEVFELSQVSEIGVHKLSKRILRVYVPNAV